MQFQGPQLVERYYLEWQLRLSAECLNWATLSNTVTRYSLSQTLMSNALHYKASKGFRYIYYICRWWLGGGGGAWGIWGGVRANLPLLCGGVLCNI